MTGDIGSDDWMGTLRTSRGELVLRGTAERIAELLRNQIAGGAVPPGARLAEEALTQALEVSRHTLREAFRLLSQERLLVHIPNRGVFVRTLSGDDIRDIYTTRRLVEGYGLAQALACTDSELEGRLEPMRDALRLGEQESAARNAQGMGTADLEFHLAIVGMADSPRLDEAASRWLTEMRLAFHLVNRSLEWHRSYLSRNRQIFEAIAKRNAGAAQTLMTQYLDDAEGELLRAQSRPRGWPRDGGAVPISRLG